MTYITYSRDESGIVQRTHSRVTLRKDDRAMQYPHAERLRGWPERLVYWSSATGPATGIAPKQ